jgi:hypothetical protein
MALAFNNRKKSWKSRGSGIIGVCSLAQQFHSFKPFYHGLSAPEPHIAPAVVQIHYRDLRPIDARIPGQWRYHRTTSTCSRTIARTIYFIRGIFHAVPLNARFTRAALSTSGCAKKQILERQGENMMSHHPAARAAGATAPSRSGPRAVHRAR